MTFRILDVDWCTSDKVILASDDGCLRVLEMSMKSTSVRLDEQELTGMNSVEGALFRGGCSLWGRAASAPSVLASRGLAEGVEAGVLLRGDAGLL